MSRLRIVFSPMRTVITANPMVAYKGSHHRRNRMAKTLPTADRAIPATAGRLQNHWVGVALRFFG